MTSHESAATRSLAHPFDGVLDAGYPSSKVLLFRLGLAVDDVLADWVDDTSLVGGGDVLGELEATFKVDDTVLASLLNEDGVLELSCAGLKLQHGPPELGDVANTEGALVASLVLGNERLEDLWVFVEDLAVGSEELETLSVDDVLEETDDTLDGGSDLEVALRVVDHGTDGNDTVQWYLVGVRCVLAERGWVHEAVVEGDETTK